MRPATPRGLLRITLAALCGLMLLPTVGVAHVEPASVSRSWEFHFTIEKPKPIAVTLVTGEVQWFWYMTYKVTNNTGQERLFVPEVAIVTDAGDVITPNRSVSTRVFNAIRDRVRNDLLDHPSEVVGRLLQGEDNARESVLIWPALPHHVSEVKVFLRGLSGETAVIANPRTGDEVLLSKTLMITYRTPGKPDSLERQTVIEESREWIMR
jgi:hypothetical protein